jgi:hypothetical protein
MNDDLRRHAAEALRDSQVLRERFDALRARIAHLTTSSLALRRKSHALSGKAEELLLKDAGDGR